MEKRELTEWCNMKWYDTASQGKRVLLIGDSITLGYSEVVRRILDKRYSLAYLCTSKNVADIAYLKELSYVLQDYPADVIHLNNGLHGWHLPVEEYARALGQILGYLQQMQPEARIIWASSTQCIQNKFAEREEEIQKRNAAATVLMQERTIEIDDLYSVTRDRRDLLTDGVHYTQEGYELLGAKVAQMILNSRSFTSVTK